MDKKILCVISARGGSKTIPKKNLKLLGGKPLIVHTIELAKQSQYIDRLIVSTDDLEIAAIVKQAGGEMPFKRSPEFSDDHVALTAVTKNAMEMMDQLGYRADIVIQLAPTCPFITLDSIDAGIQKMLDTNCDSVVSLKRIEHEHPYRAKELVNEDIIQTFLKHIDTESFQQRQDLPTLYCTSGALYIRSREILENWSGKDLCLGAQSRAIILDDIQSINIDRQLDFMFSEFLMEKMDKGEALI